MTDLAALKADLDDAEAAKEKLVDERRAKRPTMTRDEFAAYGRDTYQKQRDVQAAVNAAQVAFTEGSGRVKADAIAVALGTINETEGSG